MLFRCLFRTLDNNYNYSNYDKYRDYQHIDTYIDVDIDINTSSSEHNYSRDTVSSCIYIELR